MWPWPWRAESASVHVGGGGEVLASKAACAKTWRLRAQKKKSCSFAPGLCDGGK